MLEVAGGIRGRQLDPGAGRRWRVAAVFPGLVARGVWRKEVGDLDRAGLCFFFTADLVGSRLADGNERRVTHGMGRAATSFRRKKTQT